VTPPNEQTVFETARSTASSIRDELSTTAKSAAELADAACRLADRRAHEHPWTLALIAAALGAIVGASLASRR
jgi:ElaB/YqjD/DUF883 family membrane-anchored ribosome-binding protein